MNPSSMLSYENHLMNGRRYDLPTVIHWHPLGRLPDPTHSDVAHGNARSTQAHKLNDEMYLITVFMVEKHLQLPAT